MYFCLVILAFVLLEITPMQIWLKIKAANAKRAERARLNAQEDDDEDEYEDDYEDEDEEDEQLQAPISAKKSKKSKKNALEIVFSVLSIAIGIMLAFGNGLDVLILIVGALLAIDGVLGLCGSLKK